ILYCLHAGQVSKKRIAKEEKEKKKRLNNYLSTLFHSRARGGLRLNRTLGLRGDSNHSAQRLGSTLGVPPSPFAPSPFLFFSRGGDLNWNGVAKRRGGHNLILALD